MSESVNGGVNENEITIILPDGQSIRLDQEAAERIISQYENEGYTVIRQSNLYIVTTQPKQA